MKSKYVQLLYTIPIATAVLGAGALGIRSVPLLAANFIVSDKIVPVAGLVSPASRNLYAVNQSPKNRGSISVYDIDAGHHLIKTIHTVSSVGDVRGVVVSAVTGKLYVAYRDHSGVGMIYCLNVYNEEVLWNKAVNPGIDRLAINPDGQLLYAPTWEGGDHHVGGPAAKPHRCGLFACAVSDQPVRRIMAATCTCSHRRSFCSSCKLLGTPSIVKSAGLRAARIRRPNRHEPGKLRSHSRRR